MVTSQNSGKFNCQKLWRIWNLMFLIAIYVYSIYHSISLYIDFKLKSMDLAYGANYSPCLLNFLLASIIGGLTMISFSIYCLLFYTDNLSNDGVRLGRDQSELIRLCHNEEHSNFCVCFWVRLKRNFLPLYSFFHILSAFCLLTPLPFVEAHKINQMKMSENFWHSDLDFIFDPDKRHNYKISSSLYSTSRIWLMRPQFFNLAASLFSLALQYPAVFWFTNNSFSFVFSLLLVLSSFHILFDFSASSIMIQVSGNSNYFDRNLQNEILSPPIIMVLSIAGSLILLIGSWCIFEYGWQQYTEFDIRRQHQFLMTSNSAAQLRDDASSLSNCCQHRKHMFLRGYFPHIMALFSIGLVVGLKGPLLFYGMKVVYKSSSDLLILTNFVVMILLTVIWLMTWFGFALKSNLKFYIPHRSKTISEVSSVNVNRRLMVTSPSRDNTDTDIAPNNKIYSCFHNSNSNNNMTTSNLDNHMMNQSNSRNYYGSDENEIQNNTATANYVYLQSSMNPALQQFVSRTDSPYIGPTSINDPSSLMDQHHYSVSPHLQHQTQMEHLHNMGSGASGGCISESESSYDSATNFRNQILVNNMDPNILNTIRSQNSKLISSNILKYTANSVNPINSGHRITEYIPMHPLQQQQQQQQQQPTHSSYLHDHTNSPVTSDTRPLVNDSEVISSNSKSNYISSNNVINTNSNNVSSTLLQRQSSAKKKMYGQRVTFKDEEHLEEATIVPTYSLDRSPNNSEEQDSNNTTSSDSGIDSNSRHHRAQQLSNNNVNTNSNITSNQSETISRLCDITPPVPVSPPASTNTIYNNNNNNNTNLHQKLDNTYYNFYNPSPSTNSSKTITNDPCVTNSDAKTIDLSIAQSTALDNQSTLSFVTETDQERLCSQV